MTSLYIHIPFCVKRCPYCDFYSVSNADDGAILKYLSACLAEISSLPKVTFDTIYIGGGTPSFLGADLLDIFIDKILKQINYANMEFTLEVNPDSVDEKFCDMLASYPVTRVSMGIQSLNDGVLKLLGRIHNAIQAENAYKLLRNKTTCDINLDLMYDIPTVPFDTIKDSLRRIIDMDSEHISAYSYTPDTGYLADTPAEEPFQMTTVGNILENWGYQWYEVSNFAKIGKESLHNLNYWRMGTYYGVGAGAHSMINKPDGRCYYSHVDDVERYIENPCGKGMYETSNGESVFLEDIVFGLRMAEGVNLKGNKIPEGLLAKIDELVKEGLVTFTDGRLRTTQRGMLLLNIVMSHLWG